MCTARSPKCGVLALYG
ncbi:MAG: hypothetical protein ACTHN2_06365 [Nitrobacter sp.]